MTHPIEQALENYTNEVARIDPKRIGDISKDLVTILLENKVPPTEAVMALAAAFVMFAKTNPLVAFSAFTILKETSKEMVKYTLQQAVAEDAAARSD